MAVRERAVSGFASIQEPRYAFISKGDARLMLAEVEEVRSRAQKLVSVHDYADGGFSWPLDSFGGRMGYWLHVGILQSWDYKGSYREFALKWLEIDANILLCLLAVERQVRADVVSCISAPEAANG